MNGIHDLGGMHGFGPVIREENEPAFHAEWEKTVYALQQSTRALHLFNIDEFRHGIERMVPEHYLAASYYERWLTSIATNLIEKGIVSESELAERTALLIAHPETARPRRDDPSLVQRALPPRRRGPKPVDPDAPAPRFKTEDHVVTRNFHPSGHTRLPRYARAKRGVIASVYAAQTFPDTNAHALGRNPQTVYSVQFTARELWGESAEAREMVYIDLWESYLEPAALS